MAALRAWLAALLAAAAAVLLLAQTGATQQDPVSLAYRYIEFASAAFCEPDVILRWNCPPESCRLQQVADTNATAFITTRRTGVNSYVAYNDRLRQIIVGFRGTDNRRNFIVDIRFRKAEYAGAPENALVHQGFYNAWLEASEDIVAEVTRLQALHPDYSVACAGHSLGGALAVHCAADLRTRGFNVTAYTYGQPRVGNDAFSAWYTSMEPNSLRITKYGDIYTRLPPQGFDFRYQPTEIFQNKTGSLVVCDASGEDPTCANSVPVNELSDAAHWEYMGIAFGECYLQ